MKILYIIICLFMPFALMNAQIGINTQKPFSNLLLHIDPKGNTSAETNTQDDDVVVTQDGKMGIGTVTPNSDLTINDSIRIIDGTQGEGKVLTAKSDGTTFWATDSLSKCVQNASFTLLMNNRTPQYNTVYKFLPSPNSSFTNNIDGASLNANTGVLLLPAGFYNISISPNLPSTYDYFTVTTYINGEVFLEGWSFVSSVGFNTLYESSTEFRLNFTCFWTKPDNTISKQISVGSYASYINFYVRVEKILL